MEIEISCDSIFEIISIQTNQFHNGSFFSILIFIQIHEIAESIRCEFEMGEKIGIKL